MIIRIGDGSDETHACIRARHIIRSDGTRWTREALMEEMARQLADAADGECPPCACSRGSHA